MYFYRGFFFNIRAKGWGAIAHFAPPLATHLWATMVPRTNILNGLGFVIECSFTKVKLHSNTTETTTDSYLSD